MKVVWAPLAIERAVEQAEFIARDKPEAARNWLAGLFTAVGRLAGQPRLGRQVPELGRPDFRELDYRGYRLIYRLERNRVAVLTVRHGRRLFDRSEVEAALDE